MNVFEQLPEEPSIEFLYDNLNIESLSNSFAIDNFNTTVVRNTLIIACKYYNDIEYTKGLFNRKARNFTETSVLNIYIHHSHEGFSSNMLLWKHVANPDTGYMYQVYRKNEHKTFGSLQSALHSLLLNATVNILDESETLLTLHKHFNKFK